MTREGDGGADACKDDSTEKGEFRFHGGVYLGFVWMSAITGVHTVQLHPEPNPSEFFENGSFSSADVRADGDGFLPLTALM